MQPLVVALALLAAGTQSAMVCVPAGTFRMGCALDRRCDIVEGNAPPHDVTLSAFEIDRTEVTQAAYRACADAGACTAASCGGGAATRNHPVACVSWKQARDYCSWVHKRLPTESEWERAVRGTDQRPYPWGSNEPSCARANFLGCGGASWPVGHAPAGASAVGAFDMAGNVAEWVNDWMDSTYYRSEAAAMDPTGPGRGESRGVRGGAYDDPPSRAENALHAALRGGADPQTRIPTIGFRCARSVPRGRGGLEPIEACR